MRELPIGFREVAGFSANDDCYWVITDFKLKGSDTVKISFSVTAVCNVFGCYTNSSATTNYSLYVATSSGDYLRYNGGAYSSVVDLNKRYDVTITPTGSIGMKVPKTWTQKSFTAASDMCIGTTSTGASSASLKGSIYGRIEVVGRALFIPCERMEDGVMGYYDNVSDKFFAPAVGTPTEITS